MSDAQSLSGPLAALRVLELADEKGQFHASLDPLRPENDLPHWRLVLAQRAIICRPEHLVDHDAVLRPNFHGFEENGC